MKLHWCEVKGSYNCVSRVDVILCRWVRSFHVSEDHSAFRFMIGQSKKWPLSTISTSAVV
jgi:hypothetical protein